MKTWFWIVLVAFLLLAGYVVLDLVQRPRTRAQPSEELPFEVSAESVAVYEQRAAELQARADSLKKRMEATDQVRLKGPQDTDLTFSIKGILQPKFGFS